VRRTEQLGDGRRNTAHERAAEHEDDLDPSASTSVPTQNRHGAITQPACLSGEINHDDGTPCHRAAFSSESRFG
jgi:hypothetical protein